MTADVISCPNCGQHHVDLDFTEQPSGQGPQQVGFCPVTGEPLAWQPRAEQAPLTPPQGGLSILLTGGIGDVLALEAFMTDEERANLETIYYACPSAVAIRDLLATLPNFPKLVNHALATETPIGASAIFPHVVLPSGEKTHYSRETVERDHGPIQAQDWSVLKIFAQIPSGPPRLAFGMGEARNHFARSRKAEAPRFTPGNARDYFTALFTEDGRRRYNGSSFLAQRLCEVRRPGRPYVILCPASSWGKWRDRDFTADDWAACLEFLERWNLLGVILHDREIAAPEHPLIVHQQTTPAEAVELLKGAKGYLGIDTCWSVLAAKQPGCLAVKTVSEFTKQWRHAYFAPRDRYEFLQRTMREAIEMIQPPQPAPAALITGGIGDMFAIDTLLTEEERQAVETIYYACPNARAIRELLRGAPHAYPHLKNHVLLTNETYYNLEEVEADLGPLDGAADWSVNVIFGQLRKHRQSSFLERSLAPMTLFLTEPYYVVCPQTSLGKRPGRDFDPDDWARCIDILERANATGVILHWGKDDPVTVSGPRLLNLYNRTSLLEGIEILKHATGFIGIASALSVLAAKLFPAERLHMKGALGFQEHNKFYYYAPHTTFPFLRDAL